MSPVLVASCYGSAALLAFYALWHFGARHWYWHLLSLIVAFAVGLARLPEPFTQQGWTLVVGWVFTFAFLWSIAAPIVEAVHHPPHFHFRRH